MRELRYLTISDELRRRIAAGEYPPGALLPSESQLASEHGASRVTVRRALAELKRDAVIDSRQGFGWYVATAPLRQSLRDLTTIARQTRAAGRQPSRQLLRLAVVPTPVRLKNLLETDSVLEIARVDRVDGQPFAIATVWVRADLTTGLSRQDLEQRPLSEQLGVTLGGATQIISAVAASAKDAELIELPEGAPLIRCERTTLDSNGRAILRSEALYNPLLIEFVAELPPSHQDADPAGLRLKPASARLQR
jgi:GntR family transcriptional regulator